MKTVHVKFRDPKYNYTTSVSEAASNEEIVGYFFNQWFNMGTDLHDNMQQCICVEIEPLQANIEMEVIFDASGSIVQKIEITHPDFKDKTKKEIVDLLNQGEILTTLSSANPKLYSFNGSNVMEEIGVVKSTEAYEDMEYHQFQDMEEERQAEEEMKQWEIQEPIKQEINNE